MLKPAEMKRMELLVLERDIRTVTEGLGRLGVVHLSEARATEAGQLLSPNRIEGALARVHSLRERVTALCDALEIAEDYPAAEVPYTTPEELDAALVALEQPLGDVLERRKKLDTEIETEYQVLHDLEAFRPVEVSPADFHGLGFMHFAIGTLPAKAVPLVRQAAGEKAVLLPFKSPDGQQRLIALTSRAGRFALESILQEHHFQAERLPETQGAPPSEAARRTQERLLDLAKEQEAIREETRGIAARKGGGLAAYRQRLRVDEEILNAQAYFGRTGATVLVTGYVPSLRVDRLREELLRLTGGRVVVEVTDPAPDDPDIPTLMQNPRWLRPFEMLVAGYGQPGYREIEPTPFVAISFLLMFGVMFGDVGQGGVVALLGLYFALRGRGETLRDFGLLLCMAGGAAMAFGWVFGSVFGFERALVPPMGGWFELMKGGNIGRLLAVTVVLGVVMISLAVVMNMINRVRSRDYFAVVVDKFGVVGFIFYWGALGLGIRSIVSKGGGPTTVELLLLIVLPLGVLLLREPLHFLMTRRDTMHHRPNLFEGLIEGLVDVMETVSSYLANTVSFVRVGAFALAHAALCGAIFEVEKLVRASPGGPVWSLAIIVLGNLLVIGLEGMVVSIQAMRLEYYEFLSKFFRGEGKAYRPFKLS